VQHVDAVRHDLSFDAIQSAPGGHGLEAAIELIGQCAPLGEQLLTDVGYGSFFYLAINKDVVHSAISLYGLWNPLIGHPAHLISYPAKLAGLPEALIFFSLPFLASRQEKEERNAP